MGPVWPPAAPVGTLGAQTQSCAMFQGLGERESLVRAVLPESRLCHLESDYWCNGLVLGCCRKSSSSSAHADSLAVQLTGPLGLFGCEQDG